MVVVSAGEDKKISLWRKNGQRMGTIPVAGLDTGDNIEVIARFQTLNTIPNNAYNRSPTGKIVHSKHDSFFCWLDEL